MSPNEQLSPAAENRRELDFLLKRMPMRYDDISTCFENSLRLIRCARCAAISDTVDSEAGAGIAEVLCLAEDLVNMAYLRYLLREEDVSSPEN